MENSSNYLREHQIVKFNREASNATKNTKLARVKPARDRDRVGCFIPHHKCEPLLVDKTIFSSGCKLTFCLRCGKITETLYNCIVAGEMEDFHWTCRVADQLFLPYKIFLIH